jgi:hypothetical protein
MRLATLVFGLTVFTIAPAGLADPPALKTPAPVIYLADNLDEADQLGWCIDTQGRGFSDKLHAHSCKPQGGDVQFSLNEKTGQIMSVAFESFCMEYQPDADDPFGLVACNSDSSAQRFKFDTATSHLLPADQSTQCIVVGNASRTAGPFMSRDLLLADCSSTRSELRKWVVIQ